MELGSLLAGQSARVLSLESSGALQQRLMDMGLVKGAQVRFLYASPAGDPRAYLVRGAVIALRNRDAAQIEVIQAAPRPKGAKIRGQKNGT